MFIWFADFGNPKESSFPSFPFHSVGDLWIFGCNCWVDMQRIAIHYPLDCTCSGVFIIVFTGQSNMCVLADWFLFCFANAALAVDFMRWNRTVSRYREICEFQVFSSCFVINFKYFTECLSVLKIMSQGQ